MSAKFFADENPELQKQIGCMTGIFQMFDRQHLLTGRRLSTHKRLPSGHALPHSSSIGAGRNACSPKIVLEKNLSKISMESSRTSFSSSSCSSFSSLECNRSIQQELPTFDRTILSERPLKTSLKVKPSDNGTRPIISEPCSDPTDAQGSRHSLDFRDVVKDSIYRDARALSVKISTKEEVKNHVLKHRDSPRPAQLPKSVDRSYAFGLIGNSRMPKDLHESVQVLLKLKEAPWNFSEAGEPPRSSYEEKDASNYKPVPREARRFSYDGRETSRASLDSREQGKPISKLRELPRLSLDSREGSMRSSNFEEEPNPIFKDLDRRSISQASRAINYQKELGTHKRSPSVVAKLMGLEPMPNLSLVAQESVDLTKSYTQSDPYDAKGSSSFMSNSSNTIQDTQHDRLSYSPKNSIKDPVMPQPNKPSSVMKRVSNSRVPIEPAPWRQQDRVGASRKATFGYREAQLKPPPETVYSEIEKKLKELEFRQCNKDLRALKQILDAMQEKGLLESKKGEEQHSELSGSTIHSKQSPVASGHNLNTTNARNHQDTNLRPVLAKGSNTPRAFESPIVIMKPAKSVSGSGISASSAIPLESFSGLRKLRTSDPMDKRKASINNRTAKDRTPRYSSKDTASQPVLSSSKNLNSRHEGNSSGKTESLVVQIPSRSQQSPREKNGNSLRTSNSLSPRLQQRKLETERKLRPPLPSSESNKPQRPSGNKQPSESVSPRGKLRRRLTRVQENEDQLSEISDSRNLSQQGDEISQRSDSNISVASLLDGEVTSADRSADTNLAFVKQDGSSPSGKAVNNASLVLRQKKSSLNLNEQVSTKELKVVAPEQPSPVSVLDASFYQDNLSPSPVKKSSDALQDEKARASDYNWNLLAAPDASSPKLSSSINHKKLENIQHLVQKLSELSSSDDGARTTDHIASLCETENPDHRYVSEILLASGLLLKDLSNGPMGPLPIQLHPSGHPINPDLFLVLEQTNTTWLAKPEALQENTLRMKPRTEKLHRKLLFDVVNEILVEKLELTRQGAPINLLLGARKLIGPFPCGQRLLRELCSEIERLLAESSRGNSEDDDVSIAGEDLLRRSAGWNDFSRDVPGVVLEIERSIFKDLIDEVVSGETASVLQPKSSRRRRQLFAK